MLSSRPLPPPSQAATARALCASGDARGHLGDARGHLGDPHGHLSDLCAPSRLARALLGALRAILGALPPHLRPARAALAALMGLALLGGLALNAPARADILGGTAIDPAALPGSPEELEALTSLSLAKYATARRQAQAVLDRDPESIPGLYVLASVHHQGEGNHPRALYIIRKAQRLFEAKHGARPEEHRWQLWHRHLLNQELRLLGEMDQRQAQLDLLDKIEGLYRATNPVQRIWPLLKLARFEEARKIGEAHLHHERAWVRESAYNGMMAIEDEARNRKASYDWGKRGLEETRAESCVIASNLALAARRVFEFDEAEQYDRVALAAKDDSCPTPPYNQLAVIYLLQAKFQQALSAIKEQRSLARPPALRVQNEMDLRGRLTELLFALGQIDVAEQRVEEIISRPDRAGLTSASPESIQLSNLVLYTAVMRARQHQLEERAAVRGVFGGFKLRLEATKKAARLWEQQREAIKLAAQAPLLIDAVRPYYTDIMPWYAPALIDIFGAAVIRAALREARAAREDYPEKAGAYLLAFEADLAWRAGDLDEAHSLVEAALQRLPGQAKLLRTRLHAIRAGAITRQGGQAAQDWQVVLETQPTLLRQLDLALPARIRSEGGRQAQAAAQCLARSPRITAKGQALYEVQVQDLGEDGLEVCLYSAHGSRLHCAQVTAKEADRADGDDALAYAACDAWHDHVLSPKVELTQSDLNSLDGRPQRVSAQEALKSLARE